MPHPAEGGGGKGVPRASFTARAGEKHSSLEAAVFMCRISVKGTD